ncbi:hypothetical protein Tco_1399680 [Tanacetum coccineum]
MFNPHSLQGRRLSIEEPLSAGHRGEEDQLSAKHQLAVKGLFKCKASESNIRRIQFKNIVKEVEDYLKTYSSAVEEVLILEAYLITTLEDGPFVPMSNLSTPTNPLPKHQNQWSNAESHLANQEKRLKSIIIECLPNDVMKSVIKYKFAKEMWNELCLAYEGPFDTRDTKITALRIKLNAFKALEGEKVNVTYTRLKCLLNDLENNEVIISQSEVNAMFVNSLPRKWLSMNQTQRANNSIKNDSLATLYGKYHYEEDSDSDVKEDNRTSNEFTADLNVEYHERALLAN